MALLQFVMFILLCKAYGTAVKNNRIMGGQNASPGSWPWQATLYVNNNLCGGSLITNQWVLTAAHCISPSDLPGAVVIVGRHNLLGLNSNQAIRTLQAVICHPNYNSLTYENDICLLKLTAPVIFSDYIQPICLASETSTFNSGLSSWITGFGLTSSSSLPTILQQANVPIVGNSECQFYYQNVSVITDNMICAGLNAGGQNLCQGDLGGPLIYNQDSIWVQIGVATFGAVGCVSPARPGVFARVSKYQTWITGTVTGTPPCFVNFTSTGPSILISATSPTHAPTTTTTNAPTTVTTNAPTTAATTAATTVTTNAPTSAPTTVPTTVHSGENLIHFTHFTSLCVLVVLLHVLLGSGGM